MDLIKPIEFETVRTCAMVFQSQQNRSIFINMLYGILVDLAISGAITYFTDGDVLQLLLTWAGLQVVYALVGARNFAVGFAIVYRRRKSIEDKLTNYLRDKEFPEPDDFEVSPSQYLIDLINDDAQPVVLRLNATALLTEINTTNLMSFFRGIALNVILEEALKNHKRSFSEVKRKRLASHGKT